MRDLDAEKIQRKFIEEDMEEEGEVLQNRLENAYAQSIMNTTTHAFVELDKPW